MNVVQGKVASVVGEHQVAINKGSNDGVQMDDEIRIQKRVSISDPDDHEELGIVLLTIVTLVVVHVQERLSVGFVKDRTPGTPANPQGTRKLVTEDPFLENSSTVLVEVGQPATVWRKDAPENDG